jgi:HD superfamily phosphohydrolase
VVGDWQNLRSFPEKFVHFVLNSSIDARVVDYLRRDSLHLGISAGNVFDLGDLLPHVVFDRGRLLLRSTGMSVVEEIVSLRYWLFNRIYWNRPNRALIAMIRHVLVELIEHSGDAFEDGLRGHVLHFSEDAMLSYLADMANSTGRHDVMEICRLLRMPRPRRFEEVFDCNRGEDDAVSRQICDKICLYNGNELQRLQKELNRSVCEELHLNPDIVQVLVDVPVEKGLLKVGDDLNVIAPNGTVVPLDRLSGIVSGVQRSFNEQLQRVRIFLNPETDETLPRERKDRLRVHIRSVLEALA